MKKIMANIRIFVDNDDNNSNSETKTAEGFHIAGLSINIQHILSFKITFQFLACAT